MKLIECLRLFSRKRGTPRRSIKRYIQMRREMRFNTRQHARSIGYINQLIDVVRELERQLDYTPRQIPDPGTNLSKYYTTKKDYGVPYDPKNYKTN